MMINEYRCACFCRTSSDLYSGRTDRKNVRPDKSHRDLMRLPRGDCDHRTTNQANLIANSVACQAELLIELKFAVDVPPLYSDELRLRNDLYCVGWGVQLYSLAHSDRSTS